jgi:alkanesulfonate monooxygenase SsuD/methylene tetrahydromethanopterin reductase-like flavin-dependent oxidoreductase (luciferase family)
MGRGLGISATVDPAAAGEIAVAAERNGYTSFWVNDVPGGDGLRALAAAAEATATIRLAIGVLGLARHDPTSIATTIARLGLPVERLIVGLGAGGVTRPLAAVRSGVLTLQALVPAPVIIAASGPKMRRLAGEVAGGALFNWLIPETAREAARAVQVAAGDAGRSAPFLAAYIRCALLPAAQPAIDEELRRYGQHYDAALAPYGKSARDAIIASDDAAWLRAGIAAFEPYLSEPVVRAITPDESAGSTLRLLHACAPRHP